jgi:aromatic ring-opening dioxygenase catalytic subunit (LigB family)
MSGAHQAERVMASLGRQPTVYLTHGGGPCFWMEFPEPLGAHAYDGLRAYLAGLLASLPAPPRAIVMVSAHWEEALPTVSSAPAPPMLFDYYGFPPHTYRLEYPAPGEPRLAERVRGLLEAAGIVAAENAERGFDHGVFVPMLIIDPPARIPVVMLSLAADLDPAHHLAIGAALSPLRDEAVLLIGSGSSYHNLRRVFDGAEGGSGAFDDWLNATVTMADVAERRSRLIDWRAAPNARDCHPRAEHLIPLMVAAGAAGEDRGRATFRGCIGGKSYSCFSFGA